jgi:putative phage-type endonuclease
MSNVAYAMDGQQRRIEPGTHAVRLVNTVDMPYEEWLEWRRKGITGSDVAGICEITKWSSPVKVYLDKLGQLPPQEDNEAMYWGRIHEDSIAREYAKRTGYKVQRCNAMLQHPENEWALANIDRFIIDKERGKGVLECKTTNEYQKEVWEDGNVPEAYQLQLQWYLYVTGLSWGAFAVLIGGNKYRQFPIVERNDELIEAMVQICGNFWHKHVQAKIPPMMDGSDASSNLLKTMYPDAEPDSETELPDEADQLIAEWQQADEEMKAAEAKKKTAENRLKALIGEFEKGIASEHVVFWKPVTQRRIDSKALKAAHPDIYEQFAKPSTFRKFAIK